MTYPAAPENLGLTTILVICIMFAVLCLIVCSKGEVF